MHLLLFAFISLSAAEEATAEPTLMPSFAPTGDKMCVHLVFESEWAHLGQLHGLSGTYFINSLDPKTLPKEYRGDFKKFPIEPAFVNGRHAFTKRGSDRKLIFRDTEWHSEEEGRWENLHYNVSWSSHSGWNDHPDWSGINDDHGLFPYEGNYLWYMFLPVNREELVFIDAQLKDSFEECAGWSIAPTLNPSTTLRPSIHPTSAPTKLPTKTPTRYGTDDYVRMDGSCVNAEGKRPTSYTWMYHQFSENSPGPWDGLFDSECRKVCDEMDLCVGYETDPEENHGHKRDCIIVIERTELSGDTTGPQSDHRTCYQKKEYVDKIPDFEKMGEGKCTVNGKVPKALRVWAEKQECKKACNIIDNCFGYNVNTYNQYCYMWMEGPIDGFNATTEVTIEGDFGSCKRKVPTAVPDKFTPYYPKRSTFAATNAFRHYIIVGGVGIGLMSAAAVLVLNFKKADRREELETLI